MQPVCSQGVLPIGLDPFLVYGQRFDFTSQPTRAGMATHPDLATGMYILKRARRADGSSIGDIVSLSRLRAPAPLLPRFNSKTVDPRLSMRNCLDYSTEFWLNKYHDKELFFALTLS